MPARFIRRVHQIPGPPGPAGGGVGPAGPPGPTGPPGPVPAHLSDIADRPHAQLQALGADDHLQYLLRAGRAAAGNDVVISSDALGSLAGSASAALFTGLALNPQSGPVLPGGNMIALAHPTTSWIGPNVLAGFNNDIQVNDLPGLGVSAVLVGLQLGNEDLVFPGFGNSVWTVGDDSQGGMIVTGLNHEAKITNPTGIAKHLGKLVEFVHYRPHYVADAAVCAVGDGGGLFVVQGAPKLEAIGGGTLNVEDWTTVLTELDILGGTVNVGALRSVVHNGAAAASVSSDVAVDVHTGGTLPSGEFATLFSPDVRRRLAHAGAVLLGDVGALTSSVLLELRTTTGAFLPSRMTTAQRNALTPVNGLLLYNTDTDEIQAYVGGAWVGLAMHLV